MDIDPKNIPKEWYCPITQQLMSDPVIASDGFTYQRKAITQWFKRSDHSPLTNIKLTSTNLIPNHALRHTIEQFMEKYKENDIILEVKRKVKQLAKVEYQLPEIKVNLDSAIDPIEDQLYLRLQLQPPVHPQQKRNPVSIICILDVSESMDTDSVMGGRDVESHGFSRLDLVKHSINTMVEFMDEMDEIALVPFSTSARVALPVTRMGKDGRELVRQTVKGLGTIGTTNIWDGFKVSIQILKQLSKREKNHNTFIVLLTDGQPNLNPPRGIVPTLIKFLDLEKLPTPNIHVFGYGYELDTQLLTEISEVGHGTYTYIPDCSMVGTAFVNFMATALSTITNDVIVKFQGVEKKWEVKEIVGYKKSEKGAYNVGVLQYGQRRQLVLRYPAKILQVSSQLQLQNQKIGTVIISYNENSHKITKQLIINHKKLTENPSKMEKCILRSQYITLLNKLTKIRKNNLESGFKMVDQFYDQVEKMHEKESNEQNHQLMSVLLKQLKNPHSNNQGQVSKSLQKQQWHQKWGRHYLPSLFRAHILQSCTNFKDPALQLYGGPLFQQNRSTMDTIFIKMPPPQPSAKKVEKLVYKPVPVDMSEYYNQEGGCIDGGCQVEMEDGSRKKVEELKKGDRVVGGTVLCVVRTDVFSWIQMTKIGNLLITPWHPIRISNTWQFPSLHPSSKTSPHFITSFYNLILENSMPSILCEGIECITLGHGIQDDPVAMHQYLGSGTILQDLGRARGWGLGEVVLDGFVRDMEGSKKIVGIKVKGE